jgi:hypothetical protein
MSAVSTRIAPRRPSVHTQGVIEILTRKGFVVTWRVNKNDDIRLRVNGSREMSPLQVTNKFWSHL